MDIDPVSDWYDVPKEAVFIELSPFRLRCKGLAFSTVHVKSKM